MLSIKQLSEVKKKESNKTARRMGFYIEVAEDKEEQ